MRIFFLITAAILLYSCNNEAKQETGPLDTTASEPERKNTPDFSGCYVQVNNRDTISLALNQSGETLTGTLAFDNFEKDASSGTVQGKIEEGRAILWYEFDSEGTHSVMQIIYRQTEGGLVRAVGEMYTIGDTVVFRDRSRIGFDKDQTLMKIPCR